MKLDIKAFSIAVAILWGGAILLVGIAHMASPGYGEAFLAVASSIYPGYEVTGSFGQVLIGTLYGLVDGFIGGAIFAWLYNLLAKSA